MAPPPIPKYFQSKPSSSGIKAKASSSISIEKKKRTRLSVAEKLQLYIEVIQSRCFSKKPL